MYKNNFKKDFAYIIIGAAIKVHKRLGEGFVEHTYKVGVHNELKRMGIPCDMERKINVYDGDEFLGEYRADLVVNNTYIVEFKCCYAIKFSFIRKVKHYIKASKIQNGLIFNHYYPMLQFKRVFPR